MIILGSIGAIVAIVVLIILGKSCAVADKVTDPDRIIYTYEWFFNTYASIQSFQSQAEIAGKAVENFKTDHADNLNSYANSTELSRLRAVEQGLHNHLVATINNYNANAKNITRGLFKDWRLPAEVILNPDGSLSIVD